MTKTIKDLSKEIWDELIGIKNKDKNEIEDDFKYCELCGCFHYSNCHIKKE